jgi:sigma-B regulation protein RsbU (phosphoserine phosphatase)
MSIRWKLLILLLCISIIPILVLRTMSQRASSGLGEELAQQEEHTLIKRSEAELLRLVEDHARLAGRDKMLLETLVTMQSHVAGIALGKKALDAAPKLQWARRAMRGPGRGPGQGMGMRSAFRQQVRLSKGFTFVAGQRISESERAAAARLAAAQAEMLRLSQPHGNLILRQITVLKSGLAGIIPGPDMLPGMFEPVGTPWFQTALKADGPVWGGAHLDMLAGEPAMAVAMHIKDSQGNRTGVTAIVARVGAMLQKGRHTPAISKRFKSFLVRAGQDGGLDVVAREKELPQGRHWWLPEKREPLQSRDSAKFARMVAKLSRQKSGVLEMDYQGTRSVWAYGPADWNGLALLMIVPRQDLIAEAQAARNKVLKRIGDHIWTTSILVASVMACIVIIAIVASRTVTRRIKKMSDAVRKLRRGDLRAEVDIKGNDEIGVLGQAFNRMLPALRERLRLKESLDLAQEVQTSLLPARGIDLPGLQVTGQSRYCDETGGDFYDFIPMGKPDEPRYVLLAGDVTGHGAQAALLMATVRAFLRAELLKSKDLASAINQANRMLCMDTFGSGRFVTLFALQIDLPNHLLRWVKAGQHPALMTTPANSKVIKLDGDGLPMGVDPDIEYRSFEMPLVDDCLLAISTDGLLEAEDQARVMFGLQGLQKLMQDNSHAKPAEFLEKTFSVVRMHQNGEPQDDDFTLVAARLLPNEATN